MKRLDPSLVAEIVKLRETLKPAAIAVKVHKPVSFVYSVVKRSRLKPFESGGAISKTNIKTNSSRVIKKTDNKNKPRGKKSRGIGKKIAIIKKSQESVDSILKDCSKVLMTMGMIFKKSERNYQIIRDRADAKVAAEKKRMEALLQKEKKNMDRRIEKERIHFRKESIETTKRIRLDLIVVTAALRKARQGAL